MITVTQSVEIYEENGEEVSIVKDTPYMGVESHWNHQERVILVLGERRITVDALDLRTAINNATNTNWP